MINPPPRKRITPLSVERRLQLLTATLEKAPDASRIRIFAYGSLMWSPCFEFTVRLPGTLKGFRREFCIWSVHARGTPENPGLGLALEKEAGAHCDGMIFSLPHETAEEELIPLWEREMWTDTYTPTWVYVDVDGERVSALTFVVSKTHQNYVGEISLSEKARYIANGSGKYGRCYDYLFETVQIMRDHGIVDTDMEGLLAAVDAVVS